LVPQKYSTKELKKNQAEKAVKPKAKKRGGWASRLEIVGPGHC